MIRFRRSNTRSMKSGAAGEQTAADFLKKNGFKILERNFRCQYGEIDLIASKEEYLVFVEVKSRNENYQQTSPLISITKAKIDKIRMLGSYFLQINNIEDRQPRFDVIGITFQKDHQYQIEHIENAF